MLHRRGLRNEPAELRRLGLAIGQRAARGTFTVLEEGMTALALTEVPSPYRLRVAEGAFINPDGYLRSTVPATRGVLALLGA